MSFPTAGYTVTGAQISVSAVNNTTLDDAVITLTISNLRGNQAEYQAIQAAAAAVQTVLSDSITADYSNISIKYTSEIVG